MKPEYPRILTAIHSPVYLAEIHAIMSRIFPPHFFQKEHVLDEFHAKLPTICWTPLKSPPFNLTFFLCARFRTNAFRFFYDMICRWLFPGKRFNALMQFAVDFMMPDLSDENYFAGELTVRVETHKELEMVERHLPAIEREIRIGVVSSYHADRILEIKGLTSDGKTALIQENIASLVKRRPQDFDYDILSEMQHFLVLCKDEFKAARAFRHMSRIICVHYLFRKALRLSHETFPDRRYISIKLIRASLHGRKKVLGLVLGLSFLEEEEVFDASHILSGVRSLVGGVRLVEGSFFRNTHRGDPSHLIYIEVEREGSGGFSNEEMRLLKEELPQVLKTRIEKRLSPIFMPTNEEEIMRHILTLSSELKYTRDLPQVVISFTEQVHDALEFLVIFLRVAKPELLSIQQAFERRPTYLEFSLDRVRAVGTLRKKYKKEATVFRVRLRKHPFLREDHSVDLYKARADVAQELCRLLGEFRDYNGGMISKETEVFSALRRRLGAQASEHAFLLENFFYSLRPAVMRSVLSAEPLTKLFSMLLEAEKAGLGGGSYLCQFEEDHSFFYALLLAQDPSFREALDHLFDEQSLDLASCFLQCSEFPSLGILLRKEDEYKVKNIRHSIEQGMLEWGQGRELFEALI